jgi:hypothetical protein
VEGAGLHGSVARSRVKPGNQERRRAFERQTRRARLPWLVGESTFRMDDDPQPAYAAAVVDGCSACRAVADRLRRLVGV